MALGRLRVSGLDNRTDGNSNQHAVACYTPFPPALKVEILGRIQPRMRAGAAVHLGTPLQVELRFHPALPLVSYREGGRDEGVFRVLIQHGPRSRCRIQAWTSLLIFSTSSA